MVALRNNDFTSPETRAVLTNSEVPSMKTTLSILIRAGIYTSTMMLLVLLSAITAQSQESSLVKAEDLPPSISGPYRVQVGDVLEIRFFKSTQLNQSLAIGPDGDIYLPLIGQVKVLDRTITEVTNELNERYSAEIVEPQVTVNVREFSGLRFYVGGEVLAPGMRPYRGDLTVVKAIMEAGGFQTSAALSTVVLIRNGENDQPVGSKINVKDILHKGQFKKDIPLEPSDIIFVPRSKIANVNLFVEQFIRNNIPIPISLGFGVWVQR